MAHIDLPLGRRVLGFPERKPFKHVQEGCRHKLGTPVVPFYPFYLGVSLLKQNSRKKGTLII